MVVIPLLWGMGIFRFPVDEIIPHLTRSFFWTFFVSILMLEWAAFFLIFHVTKPHTSTYLSIDTSFLKSYKFHLFLLFAFILVMAYIAPGYLYEDRLPEDSMTFGKIGPVNSLERVAFVFIALTAGICEEVIFRGYGISVLERLVKNKWIALILSSLAFMSLHGLVFTSEIVRQIPYFIVGLVFGYLYQRYRRLELLIIAHFFLDAIMSFLAP